MKMFSIAATAAVILIGCTIEPDASPKPMKSEESRWEAERIARVVNQLRPRDIRDSRVLAAMEKVERHLFVPEENRKYAYADGPLPIGKGQTISQPYIVAYMTQALETTPEDRILEVGTGSGYQAAVLAELVDEVYSIEIVPELAATATELLADLGYSNVFVRAGDGYRGWPDKAPFDGIIVTAAPDHVPQPLIDQLKPGGKLVIPVGDYAQEMLIITRTEDGIVERRTIGVRFVPMTGEARD